MESEAKAKHQRVQPGRIIPYSSSKHESVAPIDIAFETRMEYLAILLSAIEADDKEIDHACGQDSNEMGTQEPQITTGEVSSPRAGQSEIKNEEPSAPSGRVVSGQQCGTAVTKHTNDR